MIAQDMTKFLLVTVLLGIILALAIFRPQILSSLPSEPIEEPGQDGVINTRFSAQRAEDETRNLSSEELLAWQRKLEVLRGELDQRQAALDARNAELDQRETALGEREAGLNERQARLDEREIGLDQHQTVLDERKVELDQRQAELDEHESVLGQRQVELDQLKAELQEQAASQQATEARLRRWEADLAEQEQRLHGFLRWSVAAVVVSGALAVPSVLALVALTRQGQREGLTQYGRSTKVTSAPAFSDNGRDRERVRHRR